MANLFEKVEKTRVNSNVFNLSHDRKFSMHFGALVPTLVMDLVPGDKVSLSSANFVRFAPLIAPVMHRVRVYQHFFFVPNRLVFPEWEDFITGGDDGRDETLWPHFVLDFGESNPKLRPGSLADYLGLPSAEPGGAKVRRVSAIPFAAYNMIWNDYYRDENLQTEVLDQLVPGANPVGLFGNLFQRSWRKDYFTSALPWTQKGVAATLPLGTEAPIEYKFGSAANQVVRYFSDDSLYGESDLGSAPNPANSMLIDKDTDTLVNLDVSGSHYADLSAATAATINDLRRAFKLQEWLEKNARGGSRYIESIAVHFGVRSSDARLQRPEFIGGSSGIVTISEVLQQSASPSREDPDPSTPQGNMAGHGLSVSGSETFSYFAEEHGYLMGIMSILPESAYQQGIPKHFLRRDKFEYYWPSFAHIGEQPIENQELYVSHSQPTAPFGYTPRYAEYKYIPSTVHGDFRTSLDFWHLGRKFQNAPGLNAQFITMRPQEVSRIFAVEDVNYQTLWCHVINTIKARRKMPYFGNPKF